MDYSEYTRDQLIDLVIETLSDWGTHRRSHYLDDLMPRGASGEGLHSAIEDVAQEMRRRFTPEELHRLLELVADRLSSRPSAVAEPPDPVGHGDTLSSPVITEEIPEEILAPARRVEGATSRVSVNAYERNPAAREACMQRHGVRCAVCGFDFGAVYGDLGKGFIHVHHLVPLAAVKREYVVDPDADLCPVCPNCHAMLHRHSTVLSIDELQALRSAGQS